MSAVDELGQTSPETEHGADDVVHIAGVIQGLLDQLGIKVPRALCGVLIAGDPDRPDPDDLGAPICPRCAALAGWNKAQIDEFNGRNA